jgi:putative membrane protein
MVMRKPTLEERTAIAAAVHDAEAGTSGEIVTIIADRSDAYHDVGLHYAVLAMVLVPLTFAVFPRAPDWIFGLVSDGWSTQVSGASLYLLIFAIMTAVFLIVRYTLAYLPLRLALTPKATRRRRVRRRALDLFKVGTEARTSGRTGILIYLSRGERMAEIIADAAIHSAVSEDHWGDAMAALVMHVKQGHIADGMIAAVGQVGTILSTHLARAPDDVNELPDRLIEL